jgi:hypothetical protein
LRYRQHQALACRRPFSAIAGKHSLPFDNKDFFLAVTSRPGRKTPALQNAKAKRGKHARSAKPHDCFWRLQK